MIYEIKNNKKNPELQKKKKKKVKNMSDCEKTSLPSNNGDLSSPYASLIACSHLFLAVAIKRYELFFKKK